jgi:hypothetical protein
MKKIATFLFSVFCFATSVAQDDALEEELDEEEIRRYTVEIIVFSYEENVSVGSEIFVPDAPIVEEDLLIDGDEAAIKEDEQASIIPSDDVFDEEESGIREIELVLLNEEELTLSDEIRQLELLDAYKTILHVGWTQPTYPAEETSPIELRALAEPPEGLDGTFTLYLSRYLHLVVDLALDAPDDFDVPVVVDDPAYSFGDSRLQDIYDIDIVPRPVRFRIQENRIVKNGDLRYFDHPKFGVLAKITRVEEEDEDEEDDELLQPLLSRSGH